VVDKSKILSKTFKSMILSEIMLVVHKTQVADSKISFQTLACNKTMLEIKIKFNPEDKILRTWMDSWVEAVECNRVSIFKGVIKRCKAKNLLQQYNMNVLAEKNWVLDRKFKHILFNVWRCSKMDTPGLFRDC